MTIISFLDYTSFFIFIYLGFHVFLRDRRAAVNRIFLVQCLSFAVWALCDTIAMSSGSLKTVWLMERISAVGYTTFAALVLHFFLAVTGLGQSFLNRVTLVLLYSPAVLFFMKGVSGPLAVAEFHRIPLGWHEIIDYGNPWYVAFSIYYLLYMVLSLAIAFFWWLRSKNQRIRSQARVLVIAALFPFLLGLITDVIFPLLDVALPPLTPVFILFWAVGVWYVIARYRFMALTPQAAADEIVQQMNNSMFFLNDKGIVTRVNRQVEHITHRPSADIEGVPFVDLVSDAATAKNILDKAMIYGSPGLTYETDLLIDENDSVPIRFHITPVRDKNGYLQGILVIGTDLRETRDLQREIVERARTEIILQQRERELRRRNDEIEHDLENAQLIERAMLRPAAVDLPGVNVAYRHIPMDMVGGDYYTVFPIDEKRAGLFLSDISGHGVSAALFLSLVSFLSRQVAGEYGDDPVKFMEALNSELLGSMSSYFLTAVYGVVERKSDHVAFTFVRGGHTFPVFYSKEEDRSRLIETKGPILGQFNHLSWEPETIVLKPGDRIYLYTDGLIESWIENLDASGMQRFTDLLHQASSRDLEESLDFLTGEVTAKPVAGKINDDMLLVVLEYVNS